MSTKQEIGDNIENKVSEANLGRLILDSDLRDVLKDDPESILESIYGSQLTDNNTDGTYTVDAGNFTYSIRISKVGCLILMSGEILALSNLSGANKVFDISDANLRPSDTSYSTGYIVPSNQVLAIGLDTVSYGLYLRGDISTGEQFNFSITYRVNS